MLIFPLEIKLTSLALRKSSPGNFSDSGLKVGKQLLNIFGMVLSTLYPVQKEISLLFTVLKYVMPGINDFPAKKLSSLITT